MRVTTRKIKISDLENNTGQIEGIPPNPRFIRDDKYQSLLKNIRDHPDTLEFREVFVIKHGKKYVVIAGNQRLRACTELNYKELNCKIIPPKTDIGFIKNLMNIDNINYGQWNWDILKEHFDFDELDALGMDFPSEFLSERDHLKFDDDNEDSEQGSTSTTPDHDKTKKRSKSSDKYAEYSVVILHEHKKEIIDCTATVKESLGLNTLGDALHHICKFYIENQNN